MTIYNDANNIAAVLTYSLTDKPQDFALAELTEAWDRWRGQSVRAS